MNSTHNLISAWGCVITAHILGQSFEGGVMMTIGFINAIFYIINVIKEMSVRPV